MHRPCDPSPTEQTLGTPTDTKVTMQNPQNGPPMQAISSAAESDADTAHTAAGAETTMCMKAIVIDQVGTISAYLSLSKMLALFCSSVL